MRYLCGVLAATGVLVVNVVPAVARSDGSTPAPTSIVKLVTHVPVKTLNRVGAGKISGPSSFSVTKLSGSPLTRHGKPEVLTMNLAWCPHCAANSWALTIALSRFGSLSGLRMIDSGTLFGSKYHAHPSYPHTHGISFLDAHYKSQYLSFTAVVLQSVKGRTVERPTKSEQQAISPFDANGGFPAVDAGGAYGFVNSGYSPGVLARKSASQIAGSLASPSNRMAKSIDGLANLFTAAICQATGGKPASVCGSAGVKAAGAARLT